MSTRNNRSRQSQTSPTLSKNNCEILSHHVSIEHLADRGITDGKIKENVDRSIEWSLFRVAQDVHDKSHGQRSGLCRNQNAPKKFSQHLWSLQDFDICGEVGKGHYGVVLKARRKADRERVALKRLSKQKILEDWKRGGKTFKLIKREIFIISNLQHIHINAFHGYFHDNKHLNLVMNYASLGNLYVHQRECGRLPLERARMYLRQVVSALDYLKSKNVAHRDIKQENILLAARDTIQICDFGWSINYAPGEKRSTLCGTPLYVPPEMLLTTQYDPRHVDLWSLGILAHELILGHSPFDLGHTEVQSNTSDDSRAQRRIIFDKLRQFSTFIPSSTVEDPYAMEFISHLLKKDPASRMEASDILYHPFLLDQESLEEKLPLCKTPRNRLIQRLQSSVPRKRKPISRRVSNDDFTFESSLQWTSSNKCRRTYRTYQKRRRLH